MLKNKRRNDGIDTLRLVGAFFIVCVHVSYGSSFSELGNNIQLLSRWAVPFYFIVSGFFLGPKIINEKLCFSAIRNSIITLIGALLAASIFYFPIYLVTKGFSFDISNLLTGTFFHLWFVGALLFSYGFLWYVYNVNLQRILPYLSAVTLIVVFFSDSYDQTLGLNIDFELMRFLQSIPYVYTGIYLSSRSVQKKHIKRLATLLLLSVCLLFAEAKMFEHYYSYGKDRHQILIGAFVMSICIFLLSSKVNLGGQLVAGMGRKYSLFIYLYHPFYVLVLSYIMNNVLLINDGYLHVLSPLIVFLFSLFSAIFFDVYLSKIFKLLNGDFSVFSSAK